MLLANKQKYEPKLLSNISELLQTNRMEALALMFEATHNCYQRSIKKLMKSKYKIGGKCIQKYSI